MCSRKQCIFLMSWFLYLRFCSFGVSDPLRFSDPLSFGAEKTRSDPLAFPGFIISIIITIDINHFTSSSS